MNTPPPGIPDRMWLVIWPSGERDVIRKEPNEGIDEWLKGVNATVAEYHFNAVVCTMLPEKKKA